MDSFCFGVVHMKKVDWKQVTRKWDERAKGGRSQWDRINSDPDFIEAKREIQAKYGLPLDYDIHLNNLEWIKWVGYGEKPTSRVAERGRAFLNDIDALLKKFEISEKWREDFISKIAGRQIAGPSLDPWSSPIFEHYKDKDGNFKWRCIITAETDLTNPFYLDLIRHEQKENAGDPPKPIKNKSNPRKLDWRPVYEWYKRHPLFTIEEIANKIGYVPQT